MKTCFLLSLLFAVLVETIGAAESVTLNWLGGTPPALPHRAPDITLESAIPDRVAVKRE